jgi:tight adherence protein B
VTAASTAIVLAGVAAALLPASRAGVRRLRGADADADSRRAARPRGGLLRWWPAVVATVVVWATARSPALAAAAGLLAARAAAELDARRSAAAATDRRVAVLDLLTGLAAELRAGGEPRAALATVAADHFPEVAAAARSPAADPAAALQAAASAAGAEPLADVAAAWRLIAVTGGGLAGPVRRLAVAARHDQAARQELTAQLAGPRATALLLAGLPLVGLLLGSGLGADPVGFLLGARAGRSCLLAGCLLVVTGRVWTERIAVAAAGPDGA